IAASAGITASDRADHVVANNAASQSVTVQLADLGVAIAVDRPTPDEGSTVTFTLTLTNDGPDAASGIAVTDLLPPGLSFQSATPGQGSYAGGSGVWSVGGLAAGASVTLALHATVDAGSGGATLADSVRVTAADQ